jgi:hypothetical protein
VLIVVKFFLCLSCHHCGHPMRWNNTWNWMCLCVMAMTTLAQVQMSSPITWNQPINEKTKRRVTIGYGFIQIQHETSIQTWTPQSLVMDAKAFLQHYEMQSIPHHNNNEKGGSPLDLEGNHKCNGSSWELNLWGRPNLVCKAMSKMM